MMPRRGVSLIDVEGKPFHDPAADAALFGALKSNLAENVKLVELDTDINDDAFAVACGRSADGEAPVMAIIRQFGILGA